MIELVLLLLVSTLSYLVGDLALEWFQLERKGRAEYLLYSLSAGFGILASLIMLLGFAGLIYRLLIWGQVIGFASGLLIFRWNRVKFIFSERISIFSTSSLWLKMIALLTFFYMLYQLLNCATPVINGDSIAWYLSIPKHFIENHGLLNRQLTEDYLSSNLPLNMYMLSVLGLLLKSEILSQLILGWMMSLLCFLAIYVSAKRFVKSDFAFIGASLFYVMPTMSWLIFSAKMDLGYTMFELSFWSLFLRWLSTKNNRDLYISAVFLGFAIGTKYHSLIALSCAALVAFIYILTSKQRFWVAVRTVFFFSLISLLIGAPSYLKTWFFTGDPFYPFLSSPSLVEGEGFNIYQSLLDYPRYIYNMIFGKDFPWTPMSYADYPLGFTSLAFAPLLFSVNSVKSVPKVVWITHALYFFVLTICVMLSVWPFPRHILPAWALLSIAVTIGARGYRNFSISSIVGWVMVVSILLSASLFQNTMSNNKLKAEYLIGHISKSDYLNDTVFSQRWHMNLSMKKYVEQLPPESRIITLDYGNGFYVDKPFLKKDYTYSVTNIDSINCLLQRDKITHVYFDKNTMDSYVDKWYNGKRSVIYNELVCKKQRPLFVSGSQYLFRIGM